MKDKLLYFFIISLCFIGFPSCSDDEDTSIKFYANSEEVNKVNVTSISEMYIEVRNANGTYTVKSNDETLLTASINEHSVIRIKGVKEGTTSITVTDSQNRSATLNVEVVTKTLLLSVTKHEVAVEAESQTTADQAAIDKIKSEILGKLTPVGGGFKLLYTSDNTGNLIYYPDLKNLTEKEEGTFKFEKDEVLQQTLLKFYYNSKEYIYKFGAVSGGSILKSSPPLRAFFILDFTDDYSHMTTPKISKAIGGLLIINAESFN